MALVLETGNGEIGNNGVHQIDVARWMLGQEQFPARAISIGGPLRSARRWPDGQHANRLFRLSSRSVDLRDPNYRGPKGGKAIGQFRGIAGGVVVTCEGGYTAGDFTGSAAYDKEGKKIKDFLPEGASKGAAAQESFNSLDLRHATNFIEAVRSRSRAGQKAEAQVGHVSTGCSHLANASYRLGKQSPPEAILETVRDKGDLADAFERCRDYLGESGIDLQTVPATLGPWVSFDAASERFTGPFAEEANQLSRRVYREGFVVPEVARAS